MYVATGSVFTNDANDPKEPLCTTPNCTLYYLNLNPATFVNFNTLIYAGDRLHRAGMTSKNACPNTNNPTMCVPGPTEAQANTQAGCPAGVLAQPSPNNTCVSQSPPCGGATPWQAYNRFMYNLGDVHPSWHNMTLGDVEHAGIEHWTQSRDRLIGCVDGISTGVCTYSGTGVAGDNNGCIGRNRYLLQNVRDVITAGQWALDRCPEQDDPAHCNGTQTTPSAVNWRLYIGADPTMNPNVDAIFFPQNDPNHPQLI
ncbi:MAG: hypothetical protein ACREMY_32995, partial [bacterium]